MNKNFVWIRDYWKRGLYLKALEVVFGRMPNYTWDLLFQNYDEEGFDLYQAWSFNPKSPMFFRTLWREPFHFLGGAFLTLPFLAWPFLVMIVMALISLTSFIHEYFFDADRDPDFKNLIDWLAWTLGAASVAALSLLLFARSDYR